MRGYQTKRFPRRCAARGYIRRLANPIPQHTTANPNGYVHHGTHTGHAANRERTRNRIYEQTYERKHRYAHDERRDDINGSTRIGQADGPPRQRREDQRKTDRLHRRGRLAGLHRHSYGNRDDGAVPRADARIQRHHIDGPMDHHHLPAVRGGNHAGQFLPETTVQDQGAVPGCGGAGHYRLADHDRCACLPAAAVGACHPGPRASPRH